MIKFLIQRPIAVLMAFTACFIVGLVTYFTLPVSLLPDIAIPEITVQVSAQNTSARELENTVVKPLRQQLIQVAKLKDMDSETRDGAGIIRLGFDFGTNTDLAFIEVNEKIDAAMNYLPKDAERPKVIKASATDIPVFYLNLTLKNDSAYGKVDERAFLDLCEFAENVIKRRIEQLAEVAMVDVTGLVERQLQIVPDPGKLAVLGLSIEDIENVLAQNNVEPGSMTVRDGYYEYNIKFSTLLRTEEDVKGILLRKEGRIIRLGDFCRVEIVPAKEKGVSMSNGKRAVTLAVIKQATHKAHGPQLGQQAGVEGDLVDAVHDFLDIARHLAVLDRVELHQQDIAVARLVDQRVEQGVAGVAAIPEVVAFNLDFAGHRHAGWPPPAQN